MSSFHFILLPQNYLDFVAGIATCCLGHAHKVRIKQVKWFKDIRKGAHSRRK